jgi:hypothetical protein
MVGAVARRVLRQVSVLLRLPAALALHLRHSPSGDGHDQSDEPDEGNAEEREGQEPHPPILSVRAGDRRVPDEAPLLSVNQTRGRKGGKPDCDDQQGERPEHDPPHPLAA